MLHAINDIALSATKGAEAALDATMHLLSYAASNGEEGLPQRGPQRCPPIQGIPPF